MNSSVALFLLFTGCVAPTQVAATEKRFESTIRARPVAPADPLSTEPAPEGCVQRTSTVAGALNIECTDDGAETADYAYRQTMFLGKACNRDNPCAPRLGLECKQGVCVLAPQKPE